MDFIPLAIEGQLYGGQVARFAAYGTCPGAWTGIMVSECFRAAMIDNTAGFVKQPETLRASKLVVDRG